MPYIFESCHREQDEHGQDSAFLTLKLREISEAEAVRLVSTNAMKLDRWPVLTKDGAGPEIGVRL